jgi:hypothetical protein
LNLQWRDAETQNLRDGRLSGDEMLKSLLAKGALLHREDGPAYTEIEKSSFDRNHAEVKVEQYWEKGVQTTGGPRVKKLGRVSFPAPRR